MNFSVMLLLDARSGVGVAMGSFFRCRTWAAEGAIGHAQLSVDIRCTFSNAMGHVRGETKGIMVIKELDAFLVHQFVSLFVPGPAHAETAEPVEETHGPNLPLQDSRVGQRIHLPIGPQTESKFEHSLEKFSRGLAEETLHDGIEMNPLMGRVLLLFLLAVDGHHYRSEKIERAEGILVVGCSGEDSSCEPGEPTFL